MPFCKIKHISGTTCEPTVDMAGAGSIGIRIQRAFRGHKAKMASLMVDSDAEDELLVADLYELRDGEPLDQSTTAQEFASLMPKSEKGAPPRLPWEHPGRRARSGARGTDRSRGTDPAETWPAIPCRQPVRW